MGYYNKYLKYKNKYLNLKNMSGSGNGLSCSKCLKSTVVDKLHKWYEGSCDKCLTTTERFNKKKLSQDAIKAQTYKDELLKKCTDSTKLTIDDDCFIIISTIDKKNIMTLLDKLINGETSISVHNKLKEYSVDNPIVLKFMNIYVLTKYKKKTLTHIASNYRGSEFYQMKLTEHTLPLYPIQGSVEREELMKLILNTEKKINMHNREKAEKYINDNNMNVIPPDFTDTDLIEFINKTALHAIKSNPDKYFPVQQNEVKLYKILPAELRFPTKSSKYFKEFEIIKKKFEDDIALKNKEIEEKIKENIIKYIKEKDLTKIIHNYYKYFSDFIITIAIEEIRKDPKKYFNISKLVKYNFTFIYSYESLFLYNNLNMRNNLKARDDITTELKNIHKKLLEEILLENKTNIESIKDLIKKQIDDGKRDDVIQIFLHKYKDSAQGLNLEEFINSYGQ